MDTRWLLFRLSAWPPRMHDFTADADLDASFGDDYGKIPSRHGDFAGLVVAEAFHYAPAC